jgi:hypothetical protein
MMIPKHLLSTVGLLPEEYFLYVEDTDYCRSVLKAGYRNYDNRRSVIYHKVGRATGGRFSSIMYYYGNRNRLLHHYKHYSKLNFCFFFLVFMIVRTGRFVQFLLNGDIEARKAMVRGIMDFFKIKN